MKMQGTTSSARDWVMSGNVGRRDEEERGGWPTTTRTGLSNLPPELMVMVASHLDVSSYLALASASKYLAGTLVSQLQWDVLLKRTRLDLNFWMGLFGRDDLFGPTFGQTTNSTRYMKMMWIHGNDLDEQGNEEDEENFRSFVMLPCDQISEWEKGPSNTEEEFEEEWEEEEKLFEVREAEILEMHKELDLLVGLLKVVRDPERNLLLSLLHTICERFPIVNGLCLLEGSQFKKVEIFLRCPSCKATHGVTLFGFLLLKQVEAGVRGINGQSLQSLKVINVVRGDIEDHLEDFVAHIAHQSQPLESLLETSWSDSCENRLKLLEHCAVWKLECLFFSSLGDDSAESWEKLWKRWAGVAAKGTIVELRTDEKILKHGNIADLEEVWKITTEKWTVECSQCSQEIELGVELEWSKIRVFILKVKTGTTSHNSTTFYSTELLNNCFSETQCSLRKWWLVINVAENWIRNRNN